METMYVILLILVFGGVAGASGGGILAYALVKEIRRIEKKYGEQLMNNDI